MTMDTTMAVEQPIEPLRVAIVAENFLPKIDGSTVTLAHLLEHMQAVGIEGMLFGPESGMEEYAGAKLFGTYGVPLKVYPGLKINFLSPSFISALRNFAPHVIHLVDPIWLGVQSLFALRALFPDTPIVTSHHTNLPTYAAIFGYPYFPARTWSVQAWLHSFGQAVMVPSASTGKGLESWGYTGVRVVGRGVETGMFSPTFRSADLRASWGCTPSVSSSTAVEKTVILSVARISPEKNLSLIVDAFAALPPRVRRNAKLVFVGDGPYEGVLRALAESRGLRAACTKNGAGGAEHADVIFTGQLTGRALSEAFASADVICAPSLTETFGQVTLQGMASGLPVVGLYAEGTADVVTHLQTGLLLDVYGAASASSPWSPLFPLDDAKVAHWGSADALMQEDSGSQSSSVYLAGRPSVVGRFATLMEVLICEPDMRREMGQRAAQQALAWTWERCTGKMVEVYMEVVKGSIAVEGGGVSVPVGDPQLSSAKLGSLIPGSALPRVLTHRRGSSSSASSVSSLVSPVTPPFSALASPTTTYTSASVYPVSLPSPSSSTSDLASPALTYASSVLSSPSIASPLCSPASAIWSPATVFAMAGYSIKGKGRDHQESSLAEFALPPPALSLGQALARVETSDSARSTVPGGPLASKSRPSGVRRSHRVVNDTWTRLAVDISVVLQALVGATLTHAAYMLPTMSDVFGGPRR
ncbi:unnamed protein product [Mycena citricolor]|uniref:Glycosyltransferase family 4 protein n=1 Tax=Mycena citricolor TaxID=2018698 RepID=A0AAD2Q2A0_9AGAR|nr:unnamed protein product [Mycena citricolor]